MLLARLAKDLRMACFFLTIPIPPLPAKNLRNAVSLFVAQTIPCPVAIFEKAPETRCFLKLNSALIDL